MNKCLVFIALVATVFGCSQHKPMTNAFESKEPKIDEFEQGSEESNDGALNACGQPDCPATITPPACTRSVNLTCVKTPLTTSAQSRLSFRPAPTMVYAFQITTPPTGMSFHRVIATGMSGTTSSKLLVVSKFPGDIRTDDKDLGCSRLATESTSVELAVNNPNANRHLTCYLEPNTVYYINAASKNFSGQFTCTSTSNCGFYFEGS